MMRVFIFFMILTWGGGAHALNTTANMVRSCIRMNIGTDDNYILQCPRRGDIAAMAADTRSAQFFHASDFHDVRGTIVGLVPRDSDHVYVNVARNVADTRHKNQICYRFITALDEVRDGFYAVEVCEYERPDYYL